MTYASEVLADSPLAWYRAGDLSGTTMTDSSGNGHNGSYNSAAGLGATGLVAGTTDKAADAASTRGAVTAAAWMDVNAFTAEVWVKFTTVTTNQGLIGKYATTGNGSFLLWVNLSTRIVARIYNAAGSSVDLSTSTAPVAGTLYHVVATYDGTTANLYVNNSLAATSTAISGNLRTSTANLTCANYNTQPLAGIWDEAAFYGTALSATRVAAHYTAGTVADVTVSPPAMTATAAMSAPITGALPPVDPRPAVQRTRVPLTVRIGSRHVTSEVSGLRFRKEAIGGVRNIALRLARPLDRFDTDLQAYSRVYVYDARSATTIAEGRLSDIGRSADAAAGQQWDMVAFGPVQHASDITLPLVYVDQSLERWNLADYKSAEMANSALSEDSSAGAVGMKHKPSHGQTVATTFVSAATYYAIGEAGQKLGGVITAWKAGLADTDYRATISTGVLTVGTETNAYDAAFATGTTNKTVVAVTDFTNGDDFVSLNMVRQTTTTTAITTHWLRWKSLMVRAMLKDQAGADITTGYTTAYVLAAQIVKDLLGRALPQFDGTNAVVAGGGTHQIDQLAYVDGVTPAQVLDDLMILEPAYYWTTTPSDPTSGLYGFAWKAWPTAVRYEIALDDGGSFPQSSQELWNQVVVRWRGPAGAIHQTLRTAACAVLDAAGVTRRTMIDLGDEASSLANAQRAGDNFLAAHSVPANAGTLNVSRPIRDLTTGALVEPFEIEPGELIRVRGVESYPDALNASSNDGLTVFRIWSMEYDSDSNSATLELDTYSRTTANAIARLTTRRIRKR